MPSPRTSLETIHRFLDEKRIAIIGISRNPKDIGALLLEEFRRHGVEVLPVNPNATEVCGQPCHARVQDIHPAPTAALLLTPPVVTRSVVRDCADTGVRRIWMYRGFGLGAVEPEALEFCRAQGIEVVAGECPFMYLAPVHSVHRFHRFLVKLTGNFPRKNAA